MNYPKVSVVTITYGHEKYIRETLNGVLIQQYAGPIEFIIANDNSPDQTHEVVNAYFQEHPAPDNFEIKYTRHSENKGMMSNFIWALEQATGKYIALCEGDDYWTDPLKLQKQVDFLEENEESSMVFSNATVEIESHGTETNSVRGLVVLSEDHYFSDFEILEQWTVPTASVVFRNTSQKGFYTELSNNNFIYGDIVLFLRLAQEGKIYGLKDNTVVYRRHGGGATNIVRSIDFDRKYYGHMQEILKVFGSHLRTRKIRRILAKLELSLALYEIKEKKYLAGMDYIFKTFKTDKKPLADYIRYRFNFKNFFV